jgi:transposase
MALTFVGATSVMAAPSQPSRPLGVSVPPEPILAEKGATARIPIRVLNPGDQPVTVTIAPREVLLGNDGHVSISVNADPQWLNRVLIAPDTATIGPRQFLDVVITVDVPPAITSDLHFVGFLVTPVVTAQAQVTVINQIGSFVTLDVPGPRLGLIRATLQIPSFNLGRSATGNITIANVGGSSVRFWGESVTTSSPGGATPKQARIEKTLVPIGSTRSVSVSAKPAWFVGFVTIRGQIIYPPTTDSATTEIRFSKRVLVIDPRAIAMLAGVLVLAILAWWSRRRRSMRPLSNLVTPAEVVVVEPDEAKPITVEMVVRPTRPRRSFTKEFKADVVQQVRQPGNTAASVARDLDLTPTTVREWAKQADIDEGRRDGLTTEARAELAQRRKEDRAASRRA